MGAKKDIVVDIFLMVGLDDPVGLFNLSDSMILYSLALLEYVLDKRMIFTPENIYP